MYTAISRTARMQSMNKSINQSIPSKKRKRDEPSECSSASLAAYLPQSRSGSILITSRNKDAATRLAGGFNNIKEVRVMNESQSLQLLRNKLQNTSHEEGAVD